MMKWNIQVMTLASVVHFLLSTWKQNKGTVVMIGDEKS